MVDDSKVGRVLRELRADAGFVQADVAAALGCGQAAYSKIERGAVAITIETLAVLAPIYETTPAEIVRRAEGE